MTSFNALQAFHSLAAHVPKIINTSSGTSDMAPFPGCIMGYAINKAVAQAIRIFRTGQPLTKVHADTAGHRKMEINGDSWLDGRDEVKLSKPLTTP